MGHTSNTVSKMERQKYRTSRTLNTGRVNWYIHLEKYLEDYYKAEHMQIL